VGSLPRLHHNSDFTVWSDSPVISIGERGCLIGHLFNRGQDNVRVNAFDATKIRHIADSGGRCLPREYWGGYVAALRATDGSVNILRDPSGAQPCLYGSSLGATFVSNDAGLIISATRPVFPVNFVELARFVASADWAGRETCLTGVSELIGGECLIFNDEKVDIATWWSPWEFADGSICSPFNDAVNNLRDTLIGCIGAWAGSFREIVLGVSGGLDSSIVAAAIVRANTDLRCLTMIGPDPDGDETRYARTLTNALGVPLATRRYALSDIDLDRPILPHLPRPSAAYFVQGIERAHEMLEADRPIDAFFAGNGGDSVFCSIRSAAPLVDRLLAEGMRVGLLETLKDLAELTDASWPTILRLAFRRLRRRSAATQPRHDCSGISERMIEKLGPAASRHPWMITTPPNALPGKIAHVANVMRAQKSTEFYRRGDKAVQVAPLLSQPVIEICLAIPTWQWIAGGIDRAVARAAFVGILPSVVLDRTSKGGPDGFMHSISRLRGEEIKDYLRGGLLMTEGLIDPAFIEEPHDPTWKGRARDRRMMALGAAESWARFWTRGAVGLFATGQ
jgi:asparagine synthase (glutamine-hydrolysing)